jgi:tight adherence protein C
MSPEGVIGLVVFLMVSSGVLLAFTLVGGRRSRLDDRLDVLSGRSSGALPDSTSVSQMARTALPRMGTALMPSDEGERNQLRTRLIQAGLYGRQAMPLFLGVKLMLMIAPALVGLAAGAVGLLPGQQGLLAGGCLGVLGMIGPSFWLDKKKAARQSAFRRALPDALDVIVICLEGGLSLPGALRRVSTELRAAHPTLATELVIVEREIQLGRSPGEALRQMGLRTDLEEVRSLASVITQSERFGASLVKSLRVHADTLRLKRQQHAEEMAQKAAIKVLFPTLLFIFPAVFVVILGPAAIQIMKFLNDVNNG